MKKIVYTFIVIFYAISIYAQHPDYEHPFASSVVLVGRTHNTKLHPCFIYLECDKVGNYWLKYYVDFHNEKRVIGGTTNCYGAFNIKKGKNMYLKLDNDEVLQLKCNKWLVYETGYDIVATSVYTKYLIYSYFLLSKEQIDTLKSHGFCKVRCEFKEQTRDLILEKDIIYTPFDKVEAKFIEKSEKEYKELQIREDPLSNF